MSSFRIFREITGQKVGDLIKHQFKVHVLLDGSTTTGEGYGFTVVKETSERGGGRLFLLSLAIGQKWGQIRV